MWKQKRLAALAGLVLGATLLAGGLRTFVASGAANPVPARLHGIPTNKLGPAEGRVVFQGTPAPQTLQRLLNGRHALATSTPLPDVCNASTTSSATVEQAAANAYGAVDHCGKIDSAWAVYIRQSQAEPNGMLGVYLCGEIDTLCLSGTGRYPISGWKFAPLPYKGDIKVLAQFAGHPDVYFVDIAGHQLTFDISLGKFGSG